jgi:hypothetical protein
MSSEINVLADERLFVLSNSYELDGRASTHPVDARGYAPMNCYLLKEGDHALLIGAGLAIHEQQLLDQIETVLGSARLSLMPLALDFIRLSNARPIADRFGLEFVYQPQFSNAPSFWLNFRPEFPDDDSDGLRGARIGDMITGVPIELGPTGARKLDLVVPGLRLLPNPWLYDESTRTMFTADVFTWVWRTEDEGPWVVTDLDEDTTTVEAVEYGLFENRFWWLPGAETTRIRRALANVFETYEIESIAPDYGCALTGSQVVSRHYQLLDDALAAASHRPAIGVEVGKWPFAGVR